MDAEGNADQHDREALVQAGELVTKADHPTHRVYPSAVDAWLTVILYAAPALLIALCFYFTRVARADEALTCLLVAAGLVLLNVVLTRPCRYTLTADTLHIRCGLIRESIPLDRITGAELSTSWRSGPALSLKRVRIDYDSRSRLISPRDRQQFISDLMRAVERSRQLDSH